ncbi:hypothetical protein AAW14_06530 [Streptomyces hygroscopicus]|uniref:hypothetical protein n=1 Tax=Streptomyces hygroscopicus TaxID=1912 RepID=UPI00223F0A6E|nr:hypothetical protein [Streptomyces hygroscopicus]MCW7941693.1 hypothetical protein [Streptomyces hygroscopicus]
MPVVHFWFVTVPTWMWHYATTSHVGELRGGLIGDVLTFLLWVGDAVLFLLYVAVTMVAVAFIAQFLGAMGRGIRKGYRSTR